MTNKCFISINGLIAPVTYIVEQSHEITWHLDIPKILNDERCKNSLQLLEYLLRTYCNETVSSQMRRDAFAKDYESYMTAQSFDDIPF